MESLKILAGMLEGKTYDDRLDEAEKFAKEHNLVFAFGYSDDLVEFYGAFRDEAYCYGGGDIPFTKKGVVTDNVELDEAIELLENNGYDVSSIHSQTNTVTAVMDKFWRLDTAIPHETFNLFEDGELVSVGIVFSMEDVR